MIFFKKLRIEIHHHAIVTKTNNENIIFVEQKGETSDDYKYKYFWRFFLNSRNAMEKVTILIHECGIVLLSSICSQDYNTTSQTSIPSPEKRTAILVPDDFTEKWLQKWVGGIKFHEKLLHQSHELSGNLKFIWNIFFVG